MPQCHKCPHDGRPTEACLECARREERRESFGSDLSDSRAVSLDALAGTDYEPRTPWTPTPDALAAADEREGQADAALRGIPSDALALFSDFLHDWLSLAPREMMAVSLRFEALRSPDGTPTLEQIGAEIGARCGSPDGGHNPLSKQLVKSILADAAAKVPAIAALFPAMSLTLTARQAARQAAGPPPMQGYLGF